MLALQVAGGIVGAVLWLDAVRDYPLQTLGVTALAGGIWWWLS